MFVRMNLNRKRCGDVYMRKGLITLRTVLPYYERVPVTAGPAKVGTGAGAEWMGSTSVPLVGCRMGMGQEDAPTGDNIGDAMGKLYIYLKTLGYHVQFLLHMHSTHMNDI